MDNTGKVISVKWVKNEFTEIEDKNNGQSILISTELNKTFLYCRFVTPDGQTKRQRFKPSEAEDLLKLKQVTKAEDIEGLDMPFIKDARGEWFIHQPPNYRRGNKIIYKYKRFLLNHNIIEWNKPRIFDYSKDDAVKSEPLKCNDGSYPYNISAMTETIIFIISFILLLAQVLLIYFNITTNILSALSTISLLIILVLTNSGFRTYMKNKVFPEREEYN